MITDCTSTLPILWLFPLAPFLIILVPRGDIWRILLTPWLFVRSHFGVSKPVIAYSLIYGRNMLRVNQTFRGCVHEMITKGRAGRKVLTDVLQEEGCLRCGPAPEVQTKWSSIRCHASHKICFSFGFSSILNPHLHHYWHVSLYPASIFSFECMRSIVDHGFAIWSALSHYVMLRKRGNK